MGGCATCETYFSLTRTQVLHAASYFLFVLSFATFPLLASPSPRGAVQKEFSGEEALLGGRVLQAYA